MMIGGERVILWCGACEGQVNSRIKRGERDSSAIDIRAVRGWDHIILSGINGQLDHRLADGFE